MRSFTPHFWYFSDGWPSVIAATMSFLLGVALFTAASAACSAANNVEALIAFRVLQAAGAALMTPTSLGLLLAVFPPERRGGAVRTWTAIGGLAAALGPVIGGLLVTMNWRWIFLVNVPIGLVAMLIGWWKLPEIAGHEVPRPNPLDAVLVTGGIGALTFSIVKVNDWGWGSPGIVLGFARRCRADRCCSCCAACVPTIPLSIPRCFAFASSPARALVMAPYSAAFGAMLLSVALWEQAAWGWSALKTGLAIAPGPLLVPITSLLFAGRLIARFGAAAVVTAGIVFFAAGLACWASVIGTEPNAVLVVMGMVPTGIGVGLTFRP